MLNFSEMKLQFEWGKQKAEANLAKHGISFTEAATVFDDPFHLELYDPRNSEAEDRYIVVGESEKRHILIVAHSDRNGYVRIISAREATRKERTLYEQGKLRIRR